MRDPRRKQVAANAANTSAPTDSFFDEAVREGKEILAQMDEAERGQFRLGALAHQVKTRYNDRTLAKFAAKLDIAKCTLERYRTVYRAWEGKLAPGPISTSYAALRELATHPDREKIIRENPNITKREAHERMRKHEGAEEERTDGAKTAKEADDWLKHNKRWFGSIVASAQNISFTAEIALKCGPEKQREWLKAIEPNLVEHLREGAARLVELANLLDHLFEEAEEEHRAKTEKASGRKSRAGAQETGQATA
jgi:hypothetical protein